MKYVDIVQFIDEEEETMKKALKFMFFVTARGWWRERVENQKTVGNGKFISN
jgi:hypothetical protein